MAMTSASASDQIAEHYDVLIIGAGISGIDAAHHLNSLRPDTRYAILESKNDIGGTWKTHTFPGIRSDSDLFTFGFKWKPWTGAPIATADEILRYLEEAVEENGLCPRIKFAHMVRSAAWSSDRNLWSLAVENRETGDSFPMTSRFLWVCAGYYRHSGGYTPDWPGMDLYRGLVVHPQNWPDDLDYSDKKIVVIGSGATAATIIPAMARDAAHVTMLQRSPTFYYPRPQMDDFTKTLRALDLPDAWFHEIMRRKFLHDQETIQKRSFHEPEGLAAELIGGARAYLGKDYDVETHFTPKYRPWQQRIAMIPDGDLYLTIRSGNASVVTDEIETFTHAGIRLKSGKELEADIVVTATGLNLNMLGDIDFVVDGEPRDISRSITHRGIMFTGLPNLATVYGYFRTSWTMRADLVSEYVCRLLDFMETRGAVSVTPTLRDEDAAMTIRPWIEPENFNPGYLKRSLDLLPRQGDRQPWVMTQNYFRDRVDLPNADFDDGTLVFSA
jgi:cation diffusion facilitator CzcD-associated flavoprotein CzcO